MLRPISRPVLLALLLATQAGLAMAQQSGKQAPPDQAPPKLERIEPGSDVPATVIPPKRGTEIKEYRAEGGAVTEVEVRSGGSHYYMQPNNQPGNAQTNSIRAPTWKVGEFDLSGKRKAASDAAAAPADVPPPPLPADASAGSSAGNK